ncbi:YidH family protein [Psychromonas sp. PT13]|uniref:YidH family protein n=1 Tax=Psychromonas sp. PT13 TaxID=3439547 RepID=UPI003EBB93F9
MTLKTKRVKTNWRSLGKAPDYRFSLANERTYLAWIRTAMALLAGAIAIDQLTPELANPLIRIFLSTFLCLCSGLLALFAYRRWASNERAMRNNSELSYTKFLKIISGIVIFLTTIIIIAILL